nr:hypothetical protein [Candidatus Sigynarchaeota archaeon]
MSIATTPGIDAGDRSIRFSNGVTSIEFKLDTCRYSIQNMETNESIFENAGFGFLLNDESSDKKIKEMMLLNNDFTCMRHELKEPLVPGNQGGKSAWFHLEAPKAKLAASIAFDLAPGKSRVVIRCSIINKNTYSFRMKELMPFIIDGHGVLASGTALASTAFDGKFNDLLIYYNGYQSWSLARVFNLKERQFQATTQLAQWPHHYKYMSAKNWWTRPRGYQLSNGVTVITDASGKRSVTVGFVSASSQHGEIAVRATRKPPRVSEISAISRCERKNLPPGGDVSSELLYIQDRNNYPRCLDEYADLTAAFMVPLFWDSTPFCFCTWYYYF